MVVDRMIAPGCLALLLSLLTLSSAYRSSDSLSPVGVVVLVSFAILCAMIGITVIINPAHLLTS